LTMPTIRYCVLARVGHWGSLDAECRTEPCPVLGRHNIIRHSVTFVLVNGFGDRLYLGFSIITGEADRLDVFDEDGETFASLEAAIRDHADKLLSLKAMPAAWTDRPIRHDTWQDTTATAFDAG
jgi:hypothetical protein